MQWGSQPPDCRPSWLMEVWGTCPSHHHGEVAKRDERRKWRLENEQRCTTGRWMEGLKPECQWEASAWQGCSWKC